MIPAVLIGKKGDHMKTKCLNMGLVFCLFVVTLMTVQPVKAEVTPWPVDGFWNEPAEASIFDWVYFGLYGETPSDWTCLWNFGDGTTYNQCYVDHIIRYAKDGDYTVSVQVTNSAREVSSTSRTVSVRTHDVAITKFTVPQTARVGQTRQLVVSIRNSRYPETVQVELYKSTPNGYVWFGTLSQLVPVRPQNRTTAFTFNYTFTAEDARSGKVTFKAMAFLMNDVRDALPADNEVVSLPTRVTR
jgi:hypothetical protein